MTKSKFGICPLFTFEKLISGKWMLPVLRQLEQNDGVRFGTLLRCFPEITKATLTKQLRRLEEVGLILREESDGYPRSVEYRLTAVGREFLEIFTKVEEWCECYLADKAARLAATEQEETSIGAPPQRSFPKIVVHLVDFLPCNGTSGTPSPTKARSNVRCIAGCGISGKCTIDGGPARIETALCGGMGGHPALRMLFDSASGGPMHPQGACRIRKAAKPPTAALRASAPTQGRTLGVKNIPAVRRAGGPHPAGGGTSILLQTLSQRVPAGAGSLSVSLRLTAFPEGKSRRCGAGKRGV